MGVEKTLGPFETRPGGVEREEGGVMDRRDTGQAPGMRAGQKTANILCVPARAQRSRFA